MTKVLLTKAEADKLRRQCRNTLNWTDGGHWMGTGPEPNCFQRASVSSTMTRVIKFPTDAAAFKWNAEQEKNIRILGHGATIGISVAVGLLTSGWGGVAAGSIAGIFKDEVQAHVPYPKVARGWSYTLVFVHTYSQHTAISRRPATFVQSRTGTVKDQNGKQQWSCSGKSEFSTDSFPDSIARQLASAPNSNTVITYR